MKLNIGENLRKLRLNKDITQEQMAEVFDVSPQAVSRWENNTSYPDITLLPGIAIYFGTTVDEILGMENINKAETLNMIHRDINELVRNRDYGKAVKLIKESLKHYPNDSGLLIALCETLAQKCDEPQILADAINTSEKILKNYDISLKAKGTVAANLIFLYLKDGQNKKAELLSHSLPHIWESREVLIPEIYDNNEYTEKFKNSLITILSFITQKINLINSRQYAEVPKYLQLGFEINDKIDIREILKTIGDFIDR